MAYRISIFATFHFLRDVEKLHRYFVLEQRSEAHQDVRIVKRAQAFLIQIEFLCLLFVFENNSLRIIIKLPHEYQELAFGEDY